VLERSSGAEFRSVHRGGEKDAGEKLSVVAYVAMFTAFLAPVATDLSTIVHDLRTVARALPTIARDLRKVARDLPTIVRDLR
jgi:hypothetical protein